MMAPPMLYGESSRSGSTSESFPSPAPSTAGGLTLGEFDFGRAPQFLIERSETALTPPSLRTNARVMFPWTQTFSPEVAEKKLQPQSKRVREVEEPEMWSNVVEEEEEEEELAEERGGKEEVMFR